MRPFLLVLLVTIAPLAAQAPQFRQVADLVPDGAGPAIGMADFDLDGDLDLLTNGTGIYLNDGHGLFSPHPVLSAVYAHPFTSSPIAINMTPFVGIGDFTGDGAADVIALSVFSPAVQLTLWTNQGNGVLVATTQMPSAGTSFRAMTFGDADLDGDLDLVVSHFAAGQYPVLLPLLLLLNNGAGVFVAAPAAQLSTTPMLPAQLALSDFDGDGDVDLLAGGFAFGTPSTSPLLFLSNPPGTFAQTGITIPSPPGLDVFAVRDIGGDGMTDIVLDTSPSWAACPGAATGPPLVLMAGGGGTFWPLPSSLTGSFIGGMPRLVDLNADGFPDLLRLTYRGADAFLLSPSSAGPLVAQAPLVSGPDNPEFVTNAASSAMGDVDGDGDEDVIAFTGQGNTILFNDSAAAPVVGNDRLSARRQTTLHWYDAGDLEGDGDQDLMLGFFDCGSGGGTQLEVARNDGLGNLQEGLPLPCPSCPVANWFGGRAFFDADNDGDLDAWAGPRNLVAPLQYLLINNGGTLVVAQTISAAPGTAYTRSVKVGDLDGDGDLDVVVGLGMSNTKAAVFMNNGAGVFQLSASLMVNGAGTGCDLALADLDGDGDLDVATAVSGANTVYLNAGGGSFVSLGFGSLPYYALDYIDAGDLDGDGDVDVILDNMVVLNSGNATFAIAGTIPLVSYYLGEVDLDLRLVDVDDDGDLDLVQSKGWFYRNAGNATFAAGEALPRKPTVPIAFTDFDTDGDLDLVSHGPRILTNMTRQLSRGMPARPGRPASLEIGGPPGAPWQLYASTGTTSFPFPPFGTVRLDLAGLQFATSGACGPNGLSTLTGIVPAIPAIVGFTVYWQAVVYHPSGPRLTGLEVTTVMAF